MTKEWENFIYPSWKVWNAMQIFREDSYIKKKNPTHKYIEKDSYFIKGSPTHGKRKKKILKGK